MEFIQQQGVERRYSDDVIHEQIADKWGDLPLSVRNYEPHDWYGPYVDDLGAHYDNQRLPGGYHVSTEFEGGPASVHRDAHDPLKGPLENLRHFLWEVLPPTGYERKSIHRNVNPDWRP